VSLLVSFRGQQEIRWRVPNLLLLMSGSPGTRYEDKDKSFTDLDLKGLNIQAPSQT